MLVLRGGVGNCGVLGSVQKYFWAFIQQYTAREVEVSISWSVIICAEDLISTFSTDQILRSSSQPQLTLALSARNRNCPPFPRPRSRTYAEDIVNKTHMPPTEHFKISSFILAESYYSSTSSRHSSTSWCSGRLLCIRIQLYFCRNNWNHVCSILERGLLPLDFSLTLQSTHERFW